MPGRIWTRDVDKRMEEMTNDKGEISSIDGSLAVDENTNTFWEVNPAGEFVLRRLAFVCKEYFFL